MIIGIGVDIVHIPRITALIARRGQDKLAHRILSPIELKEFQTQSLQSSSTSSYLFSRWCIKEAVYKALYPVHKLEWKHVTVTKKAGKPELSIINGELYGIKKAHVSLSHDGEYAIAQVILES